MLIIYYMASLAGSLREANNDLKVMIHSRKYIYLTEYVICYISIDHVAYDGNNIGIDLETMLFQMQLRHERTEERRKLFKIAEKRQNVTDAPLSKWKKILPALPQARETELSQNSDIMQRDDVQIAIGNSNDTTEGKELTNNDSSRREQILSNNEKQVREENDSGLNGTSSNKRYDISKIIKTFMFNPFLHQVSN